MPLCSVTQVLPSAGGSSCQRLPRASCHQPSASQSSRQTLHPAPSLPSLSPPSTGIVAEDAGQGGRHWHAKPGPVPSAVGDMEQSLHDCGAMATCSAIRAEMLQGFTQRCCLRLGSPLRWAEGLKASVMCSRHGGNMGHRRPVLITHSQGREMSSGNHHCELLPEAVCAGQSYQDSTLDL